MKERIRLIMESEHLSPSEFADKLHVGRAVISHILNGRNNPSLDVTTRILDNIKGINPDWLIRGKGQMYISNNSDNINNNSNTSFINTPNLFDSLSTNNSDLFSQTPLNRVDIRDESKYDKENIVETTKNDNEIITKQQVIYQKAPERKVVKIIIYYSDNTFETFNADNKPL